MESSVTLRTLHYFWAATKTQMGTFVLNILADVGYVLFLTYGNTWIMGLIVDRINEAPVAADQVFYVFGPYLLALAAFNILGQFCSKLQDYTTWSLQRHANYELATTVFETLCNQSMTFHANRFGGSLVSQSSKFLSAYNELINSMSYSIVTLIASIVGMVIALIASVPLFVAVLLVLLVGYFMVAYALYKRILSINAEASGAQNQLSGELSDSVTNILTVKTYGREDYERSLFDEANQLVMATDGKRIRASTARGAITSSMIALIMIVTSVFVVGGNAWFGVSAGTLVMVFTYTYNLTLRFNMINSLLQRLNRAFGDAEGMTRVLDEPRMVADDPDAKDLVVSEGAISFEDLTFGYEDARAGDHVFEHLNLKIAPGERVGLVGRSGSGKTTLTKLLLRLSDVTDGHILVDGQDVARCRQQSLRHQIAYVPQEALLFHRSIRENIAYGKPDATDDEIRAAAAEANALEFIERLPEGLDTMVGERGIKLSGGQRQRVAIARALLADCPILVLDEATSALDSESEQLVQEALANLMRGRTAIVVAHLLSTVASLDRIVVLDQGKIVESGTHEELVAAGGAYAGLWDRQTGAFLGDEGL